MLSEKKIAVVVPAYNEEMQIGMVLDTMPDFVDRIIVVNDQSTDATMEIVKNRIMKDKKSSLSLTPSQCPPQTKYNEAEIIAYKMDQGSRNSSANSITFNANDNDRIILINHTKNRGVGAAIATGYQWCKAHNIDCTAVMAGDGQMDPAELLHICKPILEEDVDYVKGNRLIHQSAWLVIPRLRFLGNSLLSIFNKIASGYWRISDTQCGFTAISLSALKSLSLADIYPQYGVPNDILVKLNIAFCTVKEVEIKPIYRVGESSKMKILNVMPLIAWLLLRSFFKRLWMKYLFRDFHPLFILYNFSFLTGLIIIPYVIKIIGYAIRGQRLSYETLLFFMFLFISGLQALLFAMWMDVQDNDRLQKN